MFNRSKSDMAKGNDVNPSSHNQIAAGTSISGDIETSGDIRIDGTLKGSIKTQGKLVVGQTGRIEGEIFCINANVSGYINGTFTIKELLTLTATAKLDGEIKTEKIAVEQGATINGHLNMGSVKEINQANRDQHSGRQKERTA